MVRFDLNLQAISSDGIVTICPSWSFLEIVFAYCNKFPIVSEEISHSRPPLIWGKISKSILGREYRCNDVFDCLLLSVNHSFGTAQYTWNSVGRPIISSIKDGGRDGRMT